VAATTDPCSTPLAIAIGCCGGEIGLGESVNREEGVTASDSQRIFLIGGEEDHPGGLTTNDLELFVSSMPEREKERGERIQHPSPMHISKGEVDRE